MIDFMFFLLALIACHRIWHHEDVFAWPRTVVKLGGVWTKPLWCAYCSPIWLGVALALAWPLLPVWAVWPLAAYPVARLMAYAYHLPWDRAFPGQQEHMKRALDEALQRARSAAPPQLPPGVPLVPPLSGKPLPAAPACTTCGSANLPPPTGPASAPSPSLMSSAEARVASAAEFTVAVPADASDADIKHAVALVIALRDRGVVSCLLGIGATSAASEAPGKIRDVRLLGASLDLDAESVLFANGDGSLLLADVLVLAGPRARSLFVAAAMSGVMMVTDAARPSSFPDPLSVVPVDFVAGVDVAAERIIDRLMNAPTYRARKAFLRRGPPSQMAVIA